MITIPSKSTKQKTTLVDALRILAWSAWKSENKDSELKGLKLYKLFDEEWSEHEVHEMTLPQLKEFIQELEYTEKELMAIREKYYQSKSQNSGASGNQQYQETAETDEPMY
ncbi:hypothetical protein [Lyngbya sp. PCC 8106]|uniref:hypothetical protein n=1 Tax=Lyngbya sp. (strain PCC 8106) TaxID=313612 RepID=UPI0000EA98D8|nr:hypothetical protein [Lyngbya sp. PCC 8106]EAW35128.1 hypothetical protein L8106_13475 [Lyngbya sp. PCC 8106]